MTNALEKYRVAHKMSCAKLAKICGYTRSAVWKHCNLGIPEGAAIRYHRVLGISLDDLVPATPTSAPAQPQEHAAPQA